MRKVAITRVGNPHHDTRPSTLATSARVRMLVRRLTKLEQDAVVTRRTMRTYERRIAALERRP